MRVSIIGPNGELWLDEVPENGTIELIKILFCLDFCYKPDTIVLYKEGSADVALEARVVR